MSFKQSPTPSLIKPEVAATSSGRSPRFRNQAGICHSDTPDGIRSSPHETLLTGFAAGNRGFHQDLEESLNVNSDRRHHFDDLFLNSGPIENGVELQPLTGTPRSLRGIRLNGYIHQKAVLPKASDEWTATRPASLPLVNSSLQLLNRFTPLPMWGAIVPHP